MISSSFLSSSILLVLLQCIVISGSTCGSNCPTGNCPSCPCGSSAINVDISAWCSQNSWNQKNCRCILLAESAGNANAVSYNSDGTYDVGLWKINKYNWNACSGGASPCDPAANLQCAIDLYNWGGNTWKFWSTCAKCGACSSS